MIAFDWMTDAPLIIDFKLCKGCKIWMAFWEFEAPNRKICKDCQSKEHSNV